MYPSDPIPPILYATVKPHKPEKNYSMCSVVSAIRTPFYGISKYLVKIIQHTLKKKVKTELKALLNFLTKQNMENIPS